MKLEIIILVVLATLCFAEKSAHLLVLKSVDKYDAVAGKNLSVTINVFNIGKGAAYNIEIDDTNWPATGVEEVEGPKVTTIATIEAGFNESITYVIAPSLPGELATGATKVTYHQEPTSQEGKIVYSNILPVLPVLTSAEYEKRHTRHIKEWFTFFVLSLIPVGLPAAMYVMAQNKLLALTGAPTAASKPKSAKK